MGLNSRQGGGGDLPSLDLAFALDKTLTPRKGPRPAFTRSSTGTFIGSNGLIQSAAIDAPRFDHDPATGDCKGLLIEEPRTNLLLRSEELATSPWGVSGSVVIIPNNAVSPSGFQTADTIDFTASGSLSQTVSMGSAGVVATFSIFVKAATSNGFTRIIVADNPSVPTNAFGGWFNTLTGLWATTSTLGSGVVIASLVTNLNNGWYRISITGSMAGISNYSPFMYITDSDNSTIRSTSVSQHWWGAQLEAGAFPTSYIPTTSGTAARSADVCSIIGADFSSFYNQSEGTVICRAVNSNGIGTLTQYPWSISDSGINNMMIVFRATSSQLRQCRFASFVSASDQLSDSNNAGLLEDNATDTIGFAIKLNDFAGSLDGNLITDNTVSLPTVDRMFIGSRVDGARYWNGHIARIQYFRKRLSNAKLQTLTAP